MVTLIYSDTEGWSRHEQFLNEKEARAYIKKEIGSQCDVYGYNPAPLLIVGDSHEVKEIEGYRYC